MSITIFAAGGCILAVPDLISDGELDGNVDKEDKDDDDDTTVAADDDDDITATDDDDDDDTNTNCVDNDGDGYGINCDAGTDCDDADESIHTDCPGCTDNDGDGFGAGCPTGDDNCDSDPDNWTSTGCSSCVDSDGDGYGTDCDLGDDCDDGDDTIHEGCLSCSIGTPPAGMAAIDCGCFNMGDSFSEGGSNELPVHNVCLSAFYMDVHEVTNAEYKACVDAGQCTAPSSSSSYTHTSYYGNATYDDYPVIYVDWNRATAYCAWAGKRLPTEAEWEYAARGGLSGKRFPWGDTIGCSDANYYSSSSYSYDRDKLDDYCVGDTSQVGDYAANGYGLYDMAGNVWEWVSDWYDSSYYSSSPTDDPIGANSGSYRVVRGGGWGGYPYGGRVAIRNYGNPTYADDGLGFRCASSSGD